jgi:glycosyltransferase involved in cell wall biosynthesis
LIAVIVPAHNEEEHIEACLVSLARASSFAGLEDEVVSIVVALDACTDRTGEIATRLGAQTVTLNACNVGAARALGADLALNTGARWLAFTDADSVVDERWLFAQTVLRSEAVCGTVAVRDWDTYGEIMKAHFAATYTDADGHRHVHGTNLGVSADAYRRVGGFMPLVSAEDVALVDALLNHGISIAWSAAPRVFTSARRLFRAPAGFGATLQRIEQLACSVPPARACA